MATRRHEIPTHLDVEDTAFLGLSIRQVMILVTGASLGYGLYNQWPALPFALRAAAAVACLLVTLVLALVRPGGRGLEDWAFVALHFLATPKASVWCPREPELREWRPAGAGWEELAPAAVLARAAMSGRASVQAARLSLEAIEDDVVLLAGGRYRAVLEVGTVNFALQGEGEQEALVAGFAACLNGLTFPIQVLVRVLPIDVDGYVGDLERRARRELPEALAELARDHIAFVRRLARNRTLLERRFYVVVPAQDDALGARRGWPFGRPRDVADAAAARKQLTFRCEELERQLGRCGLAARRLGGVELAQLHYACWCPDLARVQRLRRELVEYTALVVRAHKGGA